MTYQLYAKQTDTLQAIFSKFAIFKANATHAFTSATARTP